MQPTARYKRAVMVIIGLAFALGLATFFLPVPPSSQLKGMEFYIYLSVALTAAVLGVGAAVLFALGLKAFSRRTKIAYAFLCAGVVIYGAVIGLEVPIIGVFNLSNSFYITSGLIVLVSVSPFIFWHTGLRIFARLFEIKHLITRFWFVFPASVLFGVAAAFLPHASTSTPQIQFSIMLGISAWGLAMAVFCTATVLLIKRKATVLYANALAWLFCAFIGIIVHGIHFVGILLILGDQHWYYTGGVVTATSVTSCLLMLLAAYAFNNITTQEQVTDSAALNFFGRSSEKKLAAQVSSLDIVIFTAQLVSNPGAVDLIIDDVRLVTASMNTNQKLDADQEETLKRVYLNLEDYLTTQEPVRKFTKDSLRQHIQHTLRLVDGSQLTFWNQLS